MDDLFRLVAHDPIDLRRECDRALANVRAALREVPTAEVLEVGSTAIDGVIGKGDIDLLARVDARHFSAARAALDAAFARNPKQLSNDVYQGYVIESQFDVAIQLTIRGGEYDTFDQFIDALRASPELRAAYNQLKRDHDGKSMDVYRAAKSEFIERVLRQS